MGIKSDKTFEEIVERLVALFHGQHEDGVAEAGAPRSHLSPDSATSVPPRLHPKTTSPPANLIPD
ncbi:MAG TPA: hypothetical protein VM115_05605 [Vicinamibacterales bacterium]|nr:hypothetical protein [Vicinamibacterales bacterium]